MAIKRVGGGDRPVDLDKFAWKNTGAEIVKRLTCYVPKSIHNVVRSANTALPRDEFSFLLKCEIDWEEGIVDVSEEWYFPEQVVSAASVNYKEDAAGFNGVMHKHPGKMKTFSTTDDKWINQNFEVSILWIDDEFCNGRINIPTPAGRVQLPLDVVVAPDFEVMEDVVKVVKEKASKPKPVVATGNRVTTYGSGYVGQRNQELWEKGSPNIFGVNGGQEKKSNAQYQNGIPLPLPLVADEEELDEIDDEEYAELMCAALAGLPYQCVSDPFHVDNEGEALHNLETETTDVNCWPDEGFPLD